MCRGRGGARTSSPTGTLRSTLVRIHYHPAMQMLARGSVPRVRVTACRCLGSQTENQGVRFKLRYSRRECIASHAVTPYSAR